MATLEEEEQMYSSVMPLPHMPILGESWWCIEGKGVYNSVVV